MIKPTVGRVVLYHPTGCDGGLAVRGDQPLAAIITYVESDTCVNLAVFDVHGNTEGRTLVTLIQDDAEKPELDCYAEWMPYQKGQAAKTEELEKKLEGGKE